MHVPYKLHVPPLSDINLQPSCRVSIGVSDSKNFNRHQGKLEP